MGSVDGTVELPVGASDAMQLRVGDLVRVVSIDTDWTAGSAVVAFAKETNRPYVADA